MEGTGVDEGKKTKKGFVIVVVSIIDGNIGPGHDFAATLETRINTRPPRAPVGAAISCESIRFVGKKKKK